MTTQDEINRLDLNRIHEGQIIVCDTLSWDDEWEFDHPSMMLSPVIRCYESGRCHEGIVEDVLINAIVEGELRSESFEQSWGWRGYKLPILRRRFKESLAGKTFPKANYHAERRIVQIIKDQDGELTWKEVNE